MHKMCCQVYEYDRAVASFPGSPKACMEEKKWRAWYQPCTHAQVLSIFRVNRILFVHPPLSKYITRDVISAKSALG